MAKSNSTPEKTSSVAPIDTLTTVPTRRDYKSTSMSALPFVYMPKRGINNGSKWYVTPTDDYGLACRIGREYAAHFAQFIKDNPDFVGSNILGQITADIDFKNETETKGYWVGFFSYLERLLYAQAQRMDVFADLDRVNANYAEILAKRDLEALPRLSSGRVRNKEGTLTRINPVHQPKEIH